MLRRPAYREGSFGPIYTFLYRYDLCHQRLFMALTIKRFGFIILALAGLGAGCHSNEPEPVRYRVIQASQTAFNLEVTTTYRYDSLGRLVLVNEYPSIADTFLRVTPTALTRIYYNLTKPAQLDYVDRRLTKPKTDEDGLVAGTRRTYSYDDQGRIFYINESKALSDFTKFKFTQALQYEYGSTDLPSQLIISGPAPLLERDIYTYTFTGGNAVHLRLSVTSARSSNPVVTESDVDFDNAPNVYRNFFAIYPGITSYNKNNVINTNTTMYHDNRGLLAKRVRTGPYIDDVTVYTYETY